MATITTRAGKGSPLTNTEVDDNFSNLNSAKYESGATPTFGNVTASGYLALGQTTSFPTTGFISHTNGYLYGEGGSNGIILRSASGTSQLMFLTASEVVVNNDSLNMDFRVESNDSSHMLFVDAGDNRVSVGMSGGSEAFNIKGNMQFNHPGSETFVKIVGPDNRDLKLELRANDNNDAFIVTDERVADSERLTVNAGGELVVNQTSADYDFRVESNDNANMLFVNAGDNRVEINSSGNDENISLLVSAGVTQLNGHRFLKTAAWGSWAANTSYYLFTFQPASNGASGHAVLNIGAGGVEHYATFNLVGRNASGTTALAGYCTGASSSMFNLIGYRDNSDAAKVHVYIKPTNNVYFTPRVSISGGGSITRLTNAPTSPVDEDYTFSSGTTYNHGLKAASIHLDDNKNLNFGSSDDVRLYFDGTDSLYITATNGTADKIKTNANYTAIMQANGQQHITALANDAVIINEDSNNHDLRIESNDNANMLFVDGGNNRVSVGGTGSSQTGAAFYVEGRTTFNNGNTTGGSVILTDAYSSSTNDHLLNIGTQRSSGGPFMSYGLGHNQNSDGLWKSTYDNFSGNHSVLVLNGATLEYHLDVSNSATTVGNTVALKNGYKVGRSGAVFSDDGYSTFDFRVESQNNNHMLFVDGGASHVNIGTSEDYGGTLNVATSLYVAETDTPRIRLRNIGNSDTELGVNGLGAGLDTFYIAQYAGIAANEWDFRLTGASREFAFIRGGVVNEGAGDSDFRVETNAFTHALAVDASENAIYFGKNTNSDFNQAGMIIRASGEFIVTRASDVATFNRITSDGTLVRWRRQNVTVGQVSVNATSATYHTTSDRRLKKDIKTITDGTDKLMAMNPVTHGWKAHPEADTVHGFVAQEMLGIVPEAVAGDPEGDAMMSIDYGRITPVLVAALQDAHKKIAELETRLNELEGK
jgi:hypothetical protein